MKDPNNKCSSDSQQSTAGIFGYNKRSDGEQKDLSNRVNIFDKIQDKIAVHFFKKKMAHEIVSTAAQHHNGTHHHIISAY